MSESMYIESGRHSQYLHTDYSVIDNLIKIGSYELLGFYTGLKRYINRKSNSVENEVFFTREKICKSLQISKNKYYRFVKQLYNYGLLDLEKRVSVSYYVNYNQEDLPNPKHNNTFTAFSSINEIDVELKGKFKLMISKETGFPEDLLFITNSLSSTILILHDCPPDEFNKEEYLEYRNYESDLIRFRKKSSTSSEDNLRPSNEKQLVDKDIKGISQDQSPSSYNGNRGHSYNGNGGSSQNRNEGHSHNGKTKNIINKDINIIIDNIYNIITSYPSNLPEDKMKEMIDEMIETGTESILARRIYEIGLHTILDECTLKTYLDVLVQLFYLDEIELKKGGLTNLGIRKLMESIDLDLLDGSLKKFNAAIEKSKINMKDIYFQKIVLNDASVRVYDDQFIESKLKDN